MTAVRSRAFRLAFAPALGALLALLFAAGARAQTASLPTLTAPVNDFAHVITPQAAAELDRRIRSLHTATGDAVVVATVQSFAPFASIDEYAVRLFEKAGIGQKGHDNGVLVVVAIDEHRVRIEVGYGLEEFITDGFSGDTIRQAMLPAFRTGDYSSGLVDGTTRIINRLAQARGVTLQDVPATEPPQPSNLPVAGLVILILIFLLIGRLARGSVGRGGRRGGPWSGWYGGIGGFGPGLGGFGGFGGGGGGSGGGGFGGFGGGMSGGGGASGGW